MTGLRNALGGYLENEDRKQAASARDVQMMTGLMSVLRQQQEAQRASQMAPLQMQALQAQMAETQRRAQAAQAMDKVISGLPPEQQALARLAPQQFVAGQMRGQNPDMGIPTLLAKALNDAQKAEASGDMETARMHREYAARISRGFTPLQEGNYQGFDYRSEAGRARAADEGIPMPRPGRQFVPGGMQAPVMPQQPMQQPTAPQMQPQGQDGFPSSGRAPESARTRILAQERDQAAAAGDQAAVQAIEREMGITNFAGGASSSMGLPPRAERQIKTATVKSANEDFIKNAYRPAIADAQSARQGNNLIEAYRSIPLSKRTGWGTQAIATASNVLAGLGIAPEQAKAIASDAQMFNSLMMQQNWQMLVEQKGVQTEGDAQRARLVFAQLGNTPDANEFIWDMTKALNDNKIAKGKFFSEQYGTARQTGDLAQIEAAWTEKNKNFSLFDHPAMKKWKGRAANSKAASGVQVTAPDGKTYSFPSQQAADEFKRAIGQ